MIIFLYVILYSGWVCALLYSLLILFYLFKWRQWPALSIDANYLANTRISVIVAARNEAGHIEQCLSALQNQQYPKELYEVIVVDDHSEDETARKVSGFPSSLVKLAKLSDITPEGGKKKALEKGIALSKGRLIVTTDADCSPCPTWLQAIAFTYETHHPKLIMGPVVFKEKGTLLAKFQALDFQGMMVLTGAGWKSGTFLMGNGANLAYEKAAFYDVGAFSGVEHLSSGDDMFLIHKIASKYPGELYFMKSKEAMVSTEPAPNLAAFLMQRRRWATKNASYQNHFITFFLGLVFLLCWCILAGILGMLMANRELIFLTSTLIVAKSTVDYFMLREATSFFGSRHLMYFFLPAQGIHVLYIAVIGLWAILKKNYAWKGRLVK